MKLLKLLVLVGDAFGDSIMMVFGSVLIGQQYGWRMGLAAWMLTGASRYTGRK